MHHHRCISNNKRTRETFEIPLLHYYSVYILFFFFFFVFLYLSFQQNCAHCRSCYSLLLHMAYSMHIAHSARGHIIIHILRIQCMCVFSLRALALEASYCLFLFYFFSIFLMFPQFLLFLSSSFCAQTLTAVSVLCLIIFGTRQDRILETKRIAHIMRSFTVYVGVCVCVLYRTHCPLTVVIVRHSSVLDTLFAKKISSHSLLLFFLSLGFLFLLRQSMYNVSHTRLLSVRIASREMRYTTMNLPKQCLCAMRSESVECPGIQASNMLIIYRAEERIQHPVYYICFCYSLVKVFFSRFSCSFTRPL